ncbi:MAG TPA: hypothetical protein VHN99_01465 [Deinococcales bacterium]|nr:hypothetical protein [Deinococcales bacterium]
MDEIVHVAGPYEVIRLQSAYSRKYEHYVVRGPGLYNPPETEWLHPDRKYLNHADGHSIILGGPTFKTLARQIAEALNLAYQAGHLSGWRKAHSEESPQPAPEISGVEEDAHENTTELLPVKRIRKGLALSDDENPPKVVAVERPTEPWRTYKVKVRYRSGVEITYELNGDSFIRVPTKAPERETAERTG